MLKSLLTEKTLWRLLLKTALAVLTVFLVYDSGFNPVAFFAGLLVFGVIYFREPEEKRLLMNSFWLLPVLALAALGVVRTVSPIETASVIATFAVLFFVLLGLANLFFKERFLVYGAFNTAYFVALSLLFFFAARGPDNFWFLGAALFFFIFLLLKEAVGFFGFSGGRRGSLAAGVLGFLSVQFSYILQFLPLGFVNAAVFLALFLVLGRETLVASVKGALDFSFMMKQITFFVVLTIVIFAAAGW